MTTFNRHTSSLVTRLILALSIGLVSCASGAQDARRQVSVNGSAEVSVAPDLATINLSVESQRRTSAEAKTDVDLRVDNFLIAMEAADFPLDAIKAGQVRVSPRYNYRDGQQEFSGYTASRSLTVAVEDLSKLGNAMDIALAQNIDGINQIQYGTSLEAQLREQARVQAIADSKEKAEMLASAYGADLGPIISIHYQSQNPPTTLYEGDAMLMQQARAPSGGQYLPDQVSFSDSISVIFELIPRN